MAKTIGAWPLSLEGQQGLREVEGQYGVSTGRRESVAHHSPTLGVPRTPHSIEQRLPLTRCTAIHGLQNTHIHDPILASQQPWEGDGMGTLDAVKLTLCMKTLKLRELRRLAQGH